MKTLILNCTAFLCLSFLTVSCSKNSSPDPKPKCSVTSIKSTADSTLNITYDENGKIIFTQKGPMTQAFQYIGNNTIIILTLNSGAFTSKKYITLNNNGLITNFRDTLNATGSSWSNIAYEYSGTQVVKTTATSSSGGASTVVIYEWTNSNLTKIIAGPTIVTLEYYANEPYAVGDYFWYYDIFQAYGVALFKNKNLLKYVSSGSDGASLTYEKDTDGKIISMNINNSNPVQVNYQYKCN